MNRRSRNTLIGIAAMGIASTLAYFAFATANVMRSPEKALSKFHSGLEKRYPSVEHISTETLKTNGPSDTVFFDVRKPSEFKTSHLKNAIRVSPDINATDFLNEFGETLSNKTVVFYCSVGERSSKLAEAVATLVEPDEFKVVNLEGGIFKWHNENRTVFNAQGATQDIHPFNSYWGRLLVNKDNIREQ